MPTYPYECPKGHITRIIQHMNDPRPETLACEVCRAPATRTYMIRTPHAVVIDPFVTHVGDGKAKVVRNTAEARDIEKRFEVAELTSEDWKKINSVEGSRARRERRRKEALAQLPSIKSSYEFAANEVKYEGVEFRKERENRERHEAEQFQQTL
jgi:hypothetical protein